VIQATEYITISLHDTGKRSTVTASLTLHEKSKTGNSHAFTNKSANRRRDYLDMSTSKRPGGEQAGGGMLVAVCGDSSLSLEESALVLVSKDMEDKLA
jgi:hypothetical protein